MIELGKFLSEQLTRLPKDHPDRKTIEGMLLVVEGYNARSDGKAKIAELDLQAEWQKQAEKLAQLFAGELGLSQEEYINTLSKFGPQSENFKGRFDIPLIVETRVDIRRQCGLAGIDYWLEDLPSCDWPDDPQGYKTPNTPYITWVADGRENLRKSVDFVRENLKKDERGGTYFDGLALYIAHPGVLKHHFIDLPGTVVGSESAPYLFLLNVGPELNCRLTRSANPRYGSLVCGRN